MRIVLLATLALLFTGCSATTQPKQSTRKAKTRKARITFYGGHREKTAIGGRCKEGLTVAAHPLYKFGTWVKIPELKKWLGFDKFKVEDRGSAVTKRKASHGKFDVFDIYVASNAKLRYLSQHIPEYMEVFPE